MLCSKIGSECPHPVGQDNRFVFVMMPFKVSDNIYDAIQLAVKGIEGKDFKCMRADEKYTNVSIWCKNICRHIREAKYLIVDTTGKNPNVFYELGFSHALENTKAILITQNVKEAPFDVSDLNHIEYSPDNLKELRQKLQTAILDLEKEEEEEGYESKTTDEMIIELKSQLLQEEERASKFKKELHETEERERELKERIKEIEAIKNNPVEEAKNKIAEYEGTIAALKSKLKHTEEDKKGKIEQLKVVLKEKEEKLKILEKEFAEYKNSKDEEPLSTLLLDDTKKRTEVEDLVSKAGIMYFLGEFKSAIKFYDKAIDLNPEYTSAHYNRGNAYLNIKEYDKAIKDYNKAIELNPELADAYNNRGIAYRYIKKYKKAIKDHNRTIELKPEFAIAYNSRGIAYLDLKEYEKAIKDFNKAIELKPDYNNALENLTELYIIIGNYKSALCTIKKTSDLSLKVKHRAACLYLECIAKKMLDMDFADSEKKFNEILKKDFKTTWGFEPIVSWLDDAYIDEDKKAFIIEKTEQLKKHQAY